MMCIFTVVMTYSIVCPIIAPFGKSLWAATLTSETHADYISVVEMHSEYGTFSSPLLFQNWIILPFILLLLIPLIWNRAVVAVKLSGLYRPFVCIAAFHVLLEVPEVQTGQIFKPDRWSPVPTTVLQHLLVPQSDLIISHCWFYLPTPRRADVHAAKTPSGQIQYVLCISAN